MKRATSALLIAITTALVGVGLVAIRNPAPVVSHHELTIEADASVVWNYLTDIDHWADWNPDIKNATLNGPLAPGSTFTWKSGFSIRSTIQEVQPLARISWTGTSMGVQAKHEWSLRVVEGAVVVTTAESLQGWPITLMHSSMQETLDKSLVSWLLQLKNVSENRSHEAEGSSR